MATIKTCCVLVAALLALHTLTSALPFSSIPRNDDDDDDDDNSIKISTTPLYNSSNILEERNLHTISIPQANSNASSNTTSDIWPEVNEDGHLPRQNDDNAEGKDGDIVIPPNMQGGTWPDLHGNQRYHLFATETADGAAGGSLGDDDGDLDYLLGGVGCAESYCPTLEMCPRDKLCAMTKDCQKHLCVDGPKSQTPSNATSSVNATVATDGDSDVTYTPNEQRFRSTLGGGPQQRDLSATTETSDVGGRDEATSSEDGRDYLLGGVGCAINYCPTLELCPSGKLCAMTTDCQRYLCVDGPETPSNTTSSLNATEGDRDVGLCEGERHTICQHGNCSEEGNSCVCDQGWIGVYCETPCTLECVHGDCTILNASFTQPVDEKNMFCNCVDGWTGPRCDELCPDDADSAKRQKRILALSVGLTLLLATSFSILLPIVLWRKRVIFVLKVVYFFRMWEDNDGKTYDAYLSTGSIVIADTFVYTELTPRLERLGFKLFLPNRDLELGEVVSEGILGAIEQSRRTILVITRDYLKNEWGRFEYLLAQHETLKLQQRIIPIILEDVSKETEVMDKSLRHILQSVKCLKYPTSSSPGSSPTSSPSPSFQSLKTSFVKRQSQMDRFWHRLQLTMPKRRDIHAMAQGSQEDSRVRAKALSSVESDVGFSKV